MGQTINPPDAKRERSCVVRMIARGSSPLARLAGGSISGFSTKLSRVGERWGAPYSVGNTHRASASSTNELFSRFTCHFWLGSAIVLSELE
ncbi:hypothetical protein OPQ81_001123 [Rhizoctonia solani]|nr:hypothetical protein OPQ81_001123 [Rhizoctonia solani]